jgi:hypothetical protein
VWNDANKNGIQDAGELGIGGAVVTIDGLVDVDFSGVPSLPIGYPIATDAEGIYHFGEERLGIYKILVQIPPGTQLSPANVGDDAFDSDGETDGHGNSFATLATSCNTDFGFWQAAVAQVGTGTPGYWKTHPEAWPLPGLTIGGVYYTKAQAIAWLDLVGKDKTTTMFSSLVSARLNVEVGNDSSCVASTIVLADLWMTKPSIGYGPVGSVVQASSLAWKLGEPLHRLMDNYNNGMLCAPHRN